MGIVWRSVWRICTWILGLKGLKVSNTRMVSVAICLVLPLPSLKSTICLPMWDILVLQIFARSTIFVGVSWYCELNTIDLSSQCRWVCSIQMAKIYCLSPEVLGHRFHKLLVSLCGRIVSFIFCPIFVELSEPPDLYSHKEGRRRYVSSKSADKLLQQ